MPARSGVARKGAQWFLPLLLIVVLGVPVSASLLPVGASPASLAAPDGQVDDELQWELAHNSPGVYW